MQQRCNKWMKKKEWKDDKCRWEADEEREDEKNYWKKIFEEEREFWYNNARNRRCEEHEYKNFYEISHRWHDDNLEEFHEILFRIRRFFKRRECDADARENTKKKIRRKTRTRVSRRWKKRKQMNEFLFFVWRLYK